MAENNIVYQARLHWVLFLWPIILLAVSGYLAYTYEMIRQPALYIGLVAVIWFLVMWANYEFSLLTIKNKQVILKTGILVRKTIDIPMNKIESIDISQSIFGSLLHYGSLVITGTGGTRQMVNYINKPLTCRRYIEQQMHD
ncbi:PH domain-containing protein [Legionella yabuuchiae]|uniref:PH domain-containing protein n=1 Tax=Legionella yabuuchiae TaxID=376727 RepID=UPI0010552740|nr:PH domain-containing protein [Legionella yabuuchiae]